MPWQMTLVFLLIRMLMGIADFRFQIDWMYVNHCPDFKSAICNLKSAMALA
jgi:hypothetical protein